MADKPTGKSLYDRREAARAKHPRISAQNIRRKFQPSTGHDHDLITLGAGEEGLPIRLADAPRLEHMHVIGATGCGKSTFLLNCILQDIARGRGVCVLDPHGGHPDSLLNTVLRFLNDHNWLASRKVHIVAPNVKDWVVGFNPLAPLPETDPTVIAGAMLKAFERGWGDEDTLQKPLTRRLLRTIFTTLTERGLTLPDARLLLDYEDAPGFRQTVIAQLSNEEAREDLRWLDRLSKQPRGYETFQQTILGPVNRLAEFVSCEAIRTMLSMNSAADPPDRTIDLLDIMDRGHILLVDLQHGRRVDEAATDLLGKVLLRYLFLLIAHRKPYRLPGSERERFHPFFIYVDECHRYFTDDIAGLLAEARKYGVGLSLAHQYLAQLGKPGDKIYEALRNSTEIKAIFRVKSAKEAQDLAHDNLPLDLELPVKASVRPTQVGFTLGQLNNATYSVHEGEGESVATHAAEGISRGRTAMQNWMRAVGHASSTSHGSGIASSVSTGVSEGLSAVDSHMDSMAYTYDPNTQSFIGASIPLGLNVGNADGVSSAYLSTTSSSRGRSESSFDSQTETDSVSQGEGGALAFSEGRSKSTGSSEGRHTTRGKTTGTGASDALFPLYEMIPTSFHSKDNALYMAGETIRALPIGRAVVRFRNTVAVINVPVPRKIGS